jgi:hypothetical protein
MSCCFQIREGFPGFEWYIAKLKADRQRQCEDTRPSVERRPAVQDVSYSTVASTVRAA